MIFIKFFCLQNDYVNLRLLKDSKFPLSQKKKLIRLWHHKIRNISGEPAKTIDSHSTDVSTH